MRPIDEDLMKSKEDITLIRLSPNRLLVCKINPKDELSGSYRITNRKFISEDKKNDYSGCREMEYAQIEQGSFNEHSIIHLIETEQQKDIDELRELLNNYLGLKYPNTFDLYFGASDKTYSIDLRVNFSNSEEANAAKEKITDLNTSSMTQKGVNFICDTRDYGFQTAVIIKSIDKNQLKEFMAGFTKEESGRKTSLQELEKTLELLKKHLPLHEEVLNSFHIDINLNRIQSDFFKREQISTTKLEQLNNLGVYLKYKGKIEAQTLSLGAHNYERFQREDSAYERLIVELFDFSLFKENILNPAPSNQVMNTIPNQATSMDLELNNSWPEDISEAQKETIIKAFYEIAEDPRFHAKSSTSLLKNQPQYTCFVRASSSCPNGFALEFVANADYRNPLDNDFIANIQKAAISSPSFFKTHIKSDSQSFADGQPELNIQENGTRFVKTILYYSIQEGQLKFYYKGENEKEEYSFNSFNEMLNHIENSSSYKFILSEESPEEKRKDVVNMVNQLRSEYERITASQKTSRSFGNF
jgi:hypothetical protein